MLKQPPRSHNHVYSLCRGTRVNLNTQKLMTIQNRGKKKIRSCRDLDMVTRSISSTASHIRIHPEFRLRLLGSHTSHLAEKRTRHRTPLVSPSYLVLRWLWSTLSLDTVALNNLSPTCSQVATGNVFEGIKLDFFFCMPSLETNYKLN